MLLYLLVSALFLLTAIAADRAEDRAESEGSLHYYRELCHMGASPPLRSYFRRYGGEATFFDQQTRRTARLAMLLVALSCIGYSVMLWFAAILAFPPVYTRHKAAFKWYQAAKLEQVLAKLEDEVRGYAERRDAQRDVGDLENKADQRAVGKPTTTATHRQVRRNNSAWLLILLWSLLVLFACAGAVTTYGYDPAFHYVGIIGALLLFPSRLRRWYIAIDTSDAFVYCTAYDFITSDSRIFGRVALLTSIGLGCQLSVDCFAFCLFEILLISEKLQKVLLAVINPFNELAIATYLCVVVIAGFTVLGLLMFNADPDSKIDIDHDRIDFEWDTVEKCASAIDCICLNIYHAFVDGEMVSVTSHVKKNGYGFYSRTPSTKELQRMALQMVCNMTVVLLLLNMIAGIILDAFNQLASKETENSQKRRNECFASGVTRSRCENEEISFEALQASQNILSYIYYHAYISQKTTETDTLTEAHVRSCIANNDMSWIPSMTSWHIERRRQQRDCEQESQDAFANFIKKQEALNSKLEAAIEKLVEQTEENRKMKNLITNISSGETSRERTQESHEHQHFGNDSPMGTAARPPTSNYEIRSPKRLPSPPSHRRDARAPRRRQARILPNLQSTCRLSDFEEA